PGTGWRGQTPFGFRPRSAFPFVFAGCLRRAILPINITRPEHRWHRTRPMTDVTLTQVALFLAAAVVAAPLAKLLGIGNVLGYLFVGVLIGPFGLGFVYSVYEVTSILHFAEFGVVLLLFLIGLELRPRRLWSMRAAIFGLGGAQVLVSAALLAAI